jgi:hypothetical protein
MVLIGIIGLMVAIVVVVWVSSVNRNVDNEEEKPHAMSKNEKTFWRFHNRVTDYMEDFGGSLPYVREFINYDGAEACLQFADFYLGLPFKEIDENTIDAIALVVRALNVGHYISDATHYQMRIESFRHSLFIKRPEILFNKSDIRAKNGEKYIVDGVIVAEDGTITCYNGTKTPYKTTVLTQYGVNKVLKLVDTYSPDLFNIYIENQNLSL